jgi:hypothetical protein
MRLLTSFSPPAEKRDPEKCEASDTLTLPTPSDRATKQRLGVKSPFHNGDFTLGNGHSAPWTSRGNSEKPSPDFTYITEAA